MKISKGLAQAYALQDFAFEAAVSLRHSLLKEDGKLTVAREDAAAIAALVKSWDACQERIRIHRNKPLPGSLRPVKEAKRARREWSVPPAPPSDWQRG